MLGSRYPAMVVDRAIAENLEILPFANGARFRIAKRAGDRNAVHWLLLDAIDSLGCRYVCNVEDRGNDIDQMRELTAHAAGVLYSRWPRHNHRIPRAAKMGRDLLDPLERRVARPGPGKRIVRLRVGIADFVDLLEIIFQARLDTI